MNPSDSKKAEGFDSLSEPVKSFILDLNELMNLAGELHLFKTMHVLHEVKRKVGWEIAEKRS